MTIRFDHTVPKINKDGVTVMSDFLDKGETLAVGGETYTQVKARLKEQGYTTGLEPEAVESLEADERDGLGLDPTLTHTVAIRDQRPADGDDKRTWYDWAKTHKGLTEGYDDITKKQIIEKYGV